MAKSLVMTTMKTGPETTSRARRFWTSPGQWMQTLVVVVPDYETAGFAINGPYGTLSEPGDIVEPGWTSGGHTATDVLIWAQKPRSRQFSRALDNTDLYHIMEDALR